ncbi:MAG TPA: cell division protein FtsB [Gammaproteobacteria bacterium]|jgi:cell division protein FtsB|nr:septum formation initiator family protein [Arenicellales bacterium]HCV21318.1 cell division protein FtsB [Gammaproteobacteria bacterium]MDP6312655.1 septum formation initiator family protein [Arenicellales bacterium]MDP7191696.1 septum formation initiator family protein [Arenicellales bacterium]MDP7491131.1 septum formation initiator family protein [Arenicellales bacterium]|tara:strand:+ start:2224 stop:2514 length:291 start_codon:yes stop_codon:yes gene_type:complete
MQRKIILGLLVLLVLILQYAFWGGRNNVIDLVYLQQTLAELNMRNQALRLRNDRLHIDVNDIKNRLSAIEARARSELGLIKPGETYYQIVSPDVRN